MGTIVTSQLFTGGTLTQVPSYCDHGPRLEVEVFQGALMKIQ